MGMYLIHLVREWWWLPLAWVVVFVAGLVVMRWLVLRIPADYFVGEPKDRRSASLGRHVLILARNAAGGVLVLAGVVMIVTPGPGLLALLLGLSLLDFPGKRSLLARLVRQPRVLKAANRLRAKHGIAPLASQPVP